MDILKFFLLLTTILFVTFFGLRFEKPKIICGKEVTYKQCQEFTDEINNELRKRQ